MMPTRVLHSLLLPVLVAGSGLNAGIPKIDVQRNKDSLVIHFDGRRIVSLPSVGVDLTGDLYYFVEPQPERPREYLVWVWKVTDLVALGDYSHVCWGVTRFFFDVAVGSSEAVTTLEPKGKFTFDGSVKFGPSGATIKIEHIRGIPVHHQKQTAFVLKKIQDVNHQ